MTGGQSTTLPMKKHLNKRVKSADVRVRQIQTAARNIFVKKGYQNSSVSEIADASGISKGTIYLYFKGKDDLYVSLMMPVTEELGRELHKIKNELEEGKFRTGNQLIRRFHEAYFRIYEFDPEGLRIVFGFISGIHFGSVSKETIEKLHSLARKNLQLSRWIISKAKRLGLFSLATDEIRLSDILWATSLGVIQVEESKFRTTRKDHLRDTLSYAFSLIAKAIGGRQQGGKGIVRT
jgi:AcrR family transcriptional regulator